ncbi:SH3 domain-containing protein [Streptomyces sp. NPDC058682]|uniref:SH3 domain-containing protein n=1 Tax=unclassified Streptomyces TaxID=2593676 RepID=UPI002252EB52|nr:SH3 domain-containing protein [Streptomyces sp. NBC_01214]MCX4807770.1 SH3 domain-containing protein [Streptomyces sp. NBC_01214]
MMPSPAQPFGTVVSSSGVNLRKYPSTDSSLVGNLSHGAVVGLHSKVNAQIIDGNGIWYLLRDQAVWVAARHVDNTGDVPLSKDAKPAGPQG